MKSVSLMMMFLLPMHLACNGTTNNSDGGGVTERIIERNTETHTETHTETRVEVPAQVPDAGPVVVVPLCPVLDFNPETPITAPNFLSIAELAALSAGSHGMVKTTIRGTEPVFLPVTYLGSMPLFVGAGEPISLLWMETDPCDPRWSEWGGPAAGMSGSPIFLSQGRIAGALSYSFGTRLQPPFPFAATPGVIMAQGASASGGGFGGTEECGETCESTQSTGGAHATGAIVGWSGGRMSNMVDVASFLGMPSTVRLVSGLSAGGGLLGTCTEVGDGASPDCDVPNFGPGSAIAVPIISGDILSSAAIGTVTYSDATSILAFGHPFFGNGATNLGYTGAEVYAMMGDPTYGAYKLGVPKGRFLGVINSDRASGISGAPGLQPQLVRINSIIKDPAGMTKEFRHTVQTGLPMYTVVSASMLGAVSGYMADIDYITGGSVRFTVRTSFSGSDVPLEFLGRGYDSTDIVSQVFEELYGYYDYYNGWSRNVRGLLERFPEEHLSSVTLDGRWSEKKEVVEVIRLETDLPPISVDGGNPYPQVLPGDVINVTVTTIDRTADGGSHSYEVPFTIPTDAPAGTGRIVVSKESQLPHSEVVDDLDDGTIAYAIRQMNIAATAKELQRLYVGMYGAARYSNDPSNEVNDEVYGGGFYHDELPTNSEIVGYEYDSENLLVALDTTIAFGPNVNTTVRFTVVRTDGADDAGSCTTTDGGSCPMSDSDAGVGDAGPGDAGSSDAN